MTDSPHTPTLKAGFAQPFTVLVLMPDHMREDESCEADWVRRAWVTAKSPDDAAEIACNDLGRLMGWGAEETPSPDELAIIAIYPGHIFDLFQP